jgi:hypothetical protein
VLNAHWSRESGESRTEEYRRWRTVAGFGAVSDVDQVEYQARDGRPLLAIELCVADRRSAACPAGVPPGQAPSPAFLDAVVGKVSTERPQGRFARQLAHSLGVPVLLVVYIKGELAAGVWVKRLDAPPAAWQPLTLAEFTRRLRALHRRTTDVDQPTGV